MEKWREITAVLTKETLITATQSYDDYNTLKVSIYDLTNTSDFQAQATHSISISHVRQLRVVNISAPAFDEPNSIYILTEHASDSGFHATRRCLTLEESNTRLSISEESHLSSENAFQVNFRFGGSGKRPLMVQQDWAGYSPKMKNRLFACSFTDSDRKIATQPREIILPPRVSMEESRSHTFNERFGLMAWAKKGGNEIQICQL
jgi:hypothetical protein